MVKDDNRMKSFPFLAHQWNQLAAEFLAAEVLSKLHVWKDLMFLDEVVIKKSMT